MPRMDTYEMLLGLRDELEAEWPTMLDDLRASGMPLNVDSPDPDPDADPDADDDADDKEPTIEELKEQLEASRKELAKAKRQVAATKAAATKAAKKETTTTPTADDAAAVAALAEAQKELAETRAEQDRLKEQITKGSAVGLARGLGFRDPEDAVKLIDWEEIADPTDKAEVKDALKRIKKEKPYLTGEGRGRIGGGSGTQDGGVKTTMNDIIRGAAQR